MDCAECDKPRIIYQKMISSRERLDVQMAIPLGECTCGKHLFEKDSPYYDRIQPQLTLTKSCGDPVEQACYSSEHINREYDICSFCAAAGTDRDKELEAKFRLVLPFCKSCSQMGQKPIYKSQCGTMTTSAKFKTPAKTMFQLTSAK